MTASWQDFWLSGTGTWAPPLAKPASDTPSLSIADVAVLIKAAAQQLFPDAILTNTGYTGAVTDIDEDPDSADANWMVGTGATVLRVSFPLPDTNLVAGFLQEFRVRARP